MERTIEGGSPQVRRHLSQLKILSRLIEHELELAKGEEVVLEKGIVEAVLDTVEIFTEDMERGVARSGGTERKVVSSEGKAQVTRLN